MRRARTRTASGDFDADTLAQLVEMAGETMELEDWQGMEPTREVLKEAAKFEKAVQSALKRWVADNPEEMADDYDADDLYDEDGAYNVYMTLAGHGVGVWDGGWDHFFVDPDDAIDDLIEFLERSVGSFITDYGGGSLENAFMDAAYEQTEYAE